MKQRFGTATAFAIVVGSMVGTGVFTSLGFQLAEFESGFALMLLWVVGGICAFCGAVSYCELAAAIPRSGGEYTFLGEAFHPISRISSQDGFPSLSGSLRRPHWLQ